MPGVFRRSVNDLLPVVEQALTLGIPAITLFPVIDGEPEDLRMPREAFNPKGLVPRCVREIKKRFPEMGVITDIALDPYTTHGQDGLVDESGYVVNDETLVVLQKQALAHAEAGVDMVAPSDMMDGRVGALRGALDASNFIHTLHPRVLGQVRVGVLRPVPRRRRLRGESRARATRRPTRWIRATPTRRCNEVALDLEEGADFVMVKPGMPYLDIVRRVKERFGVPTFVYQVSGEYAMLKAAAERGWIDGDACDDGIAARVPARGRRRDPHLLRARRGETARLAGASRQQRLDFGKARALRFGIGARPRAGALVVGVEHGDRHGRVLDLEA